MMHPAMALWIFSMAMARAWQSSLGDIVSPGELPREIAVKPATTGAANLSLVYAQEYLYSEIPEVPLPSDILDKLADLYWTERDEQLAI
jgi:hypothetical protein